MNVNPAAASFDGLCLSPLSSAVRVQRPCSAATEGEISHLESTQEQGKDQPLLGLLINEKEEQEALIKTFVWHCGQKYLPLVSG